MKLVGVISTAVLSLTLGVAAPAYAQEQHEQQEDQKARPAQEEKKAQPEKQAKHEEKPAAGQQKNAKPEQKQARQEERSKAQEKSAQQHPQAQPGKQTQHATARIPDDRFKANFGAQHRFHVSQSDYSRDRRFQYGGYWFGFADPWPSNWLYTQDVFVVEINGVYYLCNPTYPGVNVALSVTL